MVPEQKNFGWIKSSGLQQGRAPSNSGWCYLLEPLNKSIITWVEFQCFRISLMHFQIHRSALKLSITITCKAAAPTFTVELWRLVKLQIFMLTHVDTLPMWRVYRTLASCRCRKFCLRACISRTEMYRNAIIICNYWLIISYILYIYILLYLMIDISYQWPCLADVLKMNPRVAEALGDACLLLLHTATWLSRLSLGPLGTKQKEIMKQGIWFWDR